MSGKSWKTEEINKLKELVSTKKYSFKQLENFIKGRTASGLQQKSIDLGLEKPYLAHKYQYNKNYFNVPNLINCWFAGWLAADGCILIRKGILKNYYDLSWECHSMDRDIQKLFAKELNYSNSAIEFIPTITPINKLYKIHSRIRLNNIESMADDLKNNFSIINNKSHRLAPPNLNTLKLKLAYLIVYINGDGCVHFNKKTKQLTISVVSCSINIIKWINDLVNSFNFPSAINKKSKGFSNINDNTYIYYISGTKAIYLFDLLRTINVPILHRKWNNPKTINGIALIKKEHPDWFKKDLDEIRYKIGLI